MYAVIKTGGRQAKVREGDVLDVQRLRAEGEVTFQPILVVGDDGSIVSERDALAKASVKGQVLGENRGKKVDVFHFRNKSGYRKSAGHRQTYTRVEITEITAPGLKAQPSKAGGKKAAAKTTPSKAGGKKAAAKPASSKAGAKKSAAKPAASKPAAKQKQEAAAKPASSKTAATKAAPKAKPKPKPKPKQTPSTEDK